MKFDKKAMRANMRTATRTALGEQWSEVREYFEAENRKLIETLKMIALLHTSGKIDDLTAKSLLEGQVLVRESLLLAVEGMTLIMVETTLNAALDSIRKAVNTALKFPLL